MVQFSSIFNGLARNISIKNGRKSKTDVGREAADALVKDAKKNDLLLSSPGIVNAKGSDNLVSVYSKRGKKGVNQDRLCLWKDGLVWQEFGCQDDMIFCGVFDGHGPWGHLVAKRVRKLMPSSLLCNWQESIALTSLELDVGSELERRLHQFDIWKQSYLKTCSAVDQELAQYPGIDSHYSGTTALTIVRQGDLIVLANVGDSRAVLATASDDGSLAAVQLTVDLKPNLPREPLSFSPLSVHVYIFILLKDVKAYVLVAVTEENERIKQSRGRVFSSSDEPGVYRIWMPKVDASGGPGLAISRAFGDYFIKDFGLISEPEVTQRNITSRDQFVILATDGVWDVISNQEAVEIVCSTPEREESAKRLVECAVSAWKRKRRGIAMDDISAICLFFHTCSSLQECDPVKHPEKGLQ
ncbi:hypothetical protein RJ639_042462 [Escallonia herrerae]|uniref:PPM-type phosphatase domain-containing protein n=1 Tax=Escallonia herrerae TaxID=1293975 RepID=A0AA89B7R9_9ASTE|nr:hypothetical protein RJ639_042462 [Escallonia herrerae]